MDGQAVHRFRCASSNPLVVYRAPQKNFIGSTPLSVKNSGENVAATSVHNSASPETSGLAPYP
jgi:hypothetical protein